jgi:hypothetical protein
MKNKQHPPTNHVIDFDKAINDFNNAKCAPLLEFNEIVHNIVIKKYFKVNGKK